VLLLLDTLRVINVERYAKELCRCIVVVVVVRHSEGDQY